MIGNQNIKFEYILNWLNKCIFKKKKIKILKCFLLVRTFNKSQSNKNKS